MSDQMNETSGDDSARPAKGFDVATLSVRAAQAGDATEAKARLLLRLTRDLQPPAVRFEHWLSRRIHLPSFITVMALCLVPWVIGAAISLADPGALGAHTRFWLRLNMFMITTGAFFLLEFIYRKIRDVVPEILYPIRDLEDVQRIERAFDFLFGCRPQCLFYGGLVPFVVVTIVFFLGIPFAGWLFAFYVVYAVASVLLAAGGVWMTIGIVYLSYEYSCIRSIRFNIFRPLDTIGVRHVADLSTTWGVCYSLEAVFILVGLWLCPWGGESSVVFLATAGWSGFVAITTFLTVVVPKVMIRGLVNRGKHLRVQWFQQYIEDYEDNMSHFTRDDIELRERRLTLLRDYNTVYSQIATAPTSSIDLQTIAKLVVSLLVPVSMFFVQNHELMLSLAELLEKVGK